MDDEITIRMDHAEEAVRTTGALSRQAFRGTWDLVSVKKDDSKIQTSCDLQIEKLLFATLGSAFPDDSIFGEEGGRREGTSGFAWLIDPIDGTASFAMGKPTFCTTVALVASSRPVGGIVYQPVLDDMIAGQQGRAAWNGRPVRASARSRLRDARVCTNPVYMFKSESQRAVLHAIRDHVLAVEYGGDAYNYAMLAAGCVDCIVACGEPPHDYLAAIPIISAAGGVVSDWTGQPPDTSADADLVVASNSVLHSKLLEFVLSG